MKSKIKLSVVIAILNEERTVASLVQTVLTWGKAQEIIIVDDEASRDHAYRALKPFQKSIIYLRNNKDQGRGDAIATGIQKATGDYVLLLDGDMVNMTHHDLDRATTPIQKNKADMVIVVPRFWKAGSFEPWNDVSGTRILLRSIALQHTDRIRNAGYGVEVLLNSLYKKNRIVVIRWPHVFVLNKFEKMSVPDAAKQYIQEAMELFLQSVKGQGKQVTPHVKKVVTGVKKYITQILDEF